MQRVLDFGSNARGGKFPAAMKALPHVIPKRTLHQAWSLPGRNGGRTYSDGQWLRTVEVFTTAFHLLSKRLAISGWEPINGASPS